MLPYSLPLLLWMFNFHSSKRKASSVIHSYNSISRLTCLRHVQALDNDYDVDNLLHQRRRATLRHLNEYKKSLSIFAQWTSDFCWYFLPVQCCSKKMQSRLVFFIFLKVAICWINYFLGWWVELWILYRKCQSIVDERFSNARKTLRHTDDSHWWHLKR